MMVLMPQQYADGGRCRGDDWQMNSAHDAHQLHCLLPFSLASSDRSHGFRITCQD
jgi:hypothetical protein